MTRRSLRRTTGALASVATLILSGTALAQVVTAVPTFHIANGQNAGPQEQQGGPGHEQGDVTHVVVGDKVYVVSIYMSSKVTEEDGPWQGKCSSIEFGPDGQPTVIADQVQVSAYPGDRPFNHARVATDHQSGQVVAIFGSDGVNGEAANVSTYVQTFDHMCNPTSDPVRVSNNANNNEGAPDIICHGNGYCTAGYLSTGNNDTSFALGLMVSDLGGGQATVERTWLQGVVAPSNIGRPALASSAPNTALFCAAKGDNRPPEDGVQCAMLNTMDGSIMYKQIIAASQPGEQIYMNQPTVGTLDLGRFAVQVLESSGQGKINNDKGSNVTHAYVIEPQGESFLIKDHKVGLGSYHTHSAICSGEYGIEGKRHFGILGAPITGNGQPSFQMLSYDATLGIAQDKTMNKWVVGWYGDSGKLANMYGQNPNTQGRDFLRCKGDIPNPGVGQANGYLPHVKSFFVTPHSGRIDGEEKNSQWLSFVPGATSEVVEPAAPADPGTIKPGPSDSYTGDPNPPQAAPQDDPVPGGNEGKDPSVLTTPSAGCSAGGRDSGDFGGAAGLAMLGLGLALASRRSRKGV